MFEPVNKRRLVAYRTKSKLLDCLLFQKHKLEKQINGVSGIDYTRSKVTTGNGNYTSQEENYVLKLEKINKKIDNVRVFLNSEYELIYNRIKCISSRYQDILIMRYLEGENWSYITELLYGNKPDFEFYKYTKYHTYVMLYHKKALTELEHDSRQEKLQLF